MVISHRQLLSHLNSPHFRGLYSHSRYTSYPVCASNGVIFVFSPTVFTFMRHTFLSDPPQSVEYTHPNCPQLSKHKILSPKGRVFSTSQISCIKHFSHIEADMCDEQMLPSLLVQEVFLYDLHTLHTDCLFVAELLIWASTFCLQSIAREWQTQMSYNHGNPLTFLFNWILVFDSSHNGFYFIEKLNFSYIIPISWHKHGYCKKTETDRGGHTFNMTSHHQVKLSYLKLTLASSISRPVTISNKTVTIN